LIDEKFVLLTITGLANGAILALAALGFVVVFKATGVINFAQGEFLLVGAYLIHQFYTEWGWHWGVSIVVAMALAVVMGIAIERLILRPLIGENIISVIMVTIGLSAALLALVLGVWGTQPRPAPQFISAESIKILGASVPISRVVAVGIAGVVFSAFAVFFRRSKQGVAMRAVADDQQAAMMQGISVNRVFALSWALAAASAVLGGMLLSQIGGGVSPEIAGFGVIVFPVVILGGLDSIPGAVVGGIVIGLISQYSGGYLLSGSQDVVPFVILVLILLVKPYGLFGQVRIERV